MFFKSPVISDADIRKLVLFYLINTLFIYSSPDLQVFLIRSRFAGLRIRSCFSGMILHKTLKLVYQHIFFALFDGIFQIFPAVHIDNFIERFTLLSHKPYLKYRMRTYSCISELAFSGSFCFTKITKLFVGLIDTYHPVGIKPCLAVKLSSELPVFFCGGQLVFFLSFIIILLFCSLPFLCSPGLFSLHFGLSIRVVFSESSCLFSKRRRFVRIQDYLMEHHIICRIHAGTHKLDLHVFFSLFVSEISPFFAISVHGFTGIVCFLTVFLEVSAVDLYHVKLVQSDCIQITLCIHAAVCLENSIIEGIKGGLSLLRCHIRNRRRSPAFRRKSFSEFFNLRLHIPAVH